MKAVIVIVICLFTLNSCKKKKEEHNIVDKKEDIQYISFGKKIIANDAIAATSMAYHYKTMLVGDSINSKMRARVTNVCKVTGCWMTLDLENGHEVMVEFEGARFFVPSDISEKEVIVNGKAYVNEILFDKQKKNNEVITSRKVYAFEADGVLLKK